LERARLSYCHPDNLWSPGIPSRKIQAQRAKNSIIGIGDPIVQIVFPVTPDTAPLSQQSEASHVPFDIEIVQRMQIVLFHAR
jgi:hypothetical protein